MNMLAQILPGFRDFRTPFMTGVLWLTALWVSLGTPIPKKDDKEGIFGLLNHVSEYLSPALILGVFSFTAYLLGVLLMPNLHRKLRRGTVRIHLMKTKTNKRYNASNNRVVKRLLRKAGLHYRQPEYARPGGHTSKSFDLLDSLAMEAVYTAGKTGLDLVPLKKHYDWLAPEVRGENEDEKLADYVTKDLLEEAATIAAALQAGNERVFNNYDRARSEAEFRFSIHMPLFFIAAGITWNLWNADIILAVLIGVAGVVVSSVLFVKGIHKMNEATEIGSEAIKAGVVPSKALDRVPGWNKKDEKSPAPAST
jgi:Zn-dependent protease with chaperone function